jgi:hypothetical protein
MIGALVLSALCLLWLERILNTRATRDRRDEPQFSPA